MASHVFLQRFTTNGRAPSASDRVSRRLFIHRDLHTSIFIPAPSLRPPPLGMPDTLSTMAHARPGPGVLCWLLWAWWCSDRIWDRSWVLGVLDPPPPLSPSPPNPSAHWTLEMARRWHWHWSCPPAAPRTSPKTTHRTHRAQSRHRSAHSPLASPRHSPLLVTPLSSPLPSPHHSPIRYVSYQPINHASTMVCGYL